MICPNREKIEEKKSGQQIQTHTRGHRRATDRDTINNRCEQIELLDWRPSAQQPLLWDGGPTLVCPRVATRPQTLPLLCDGCFIFTS